MRIVENHSEVAKDFAANGAVVAVAGSCSTMRGRECRDWLFDFERTALQGGDSTQPFAKLSTQAESVRVDARKLFLEQMMLLDEGTVRRRAE